MAISWCHTIKVICFPEKVWKYLVCNALFRQYLGQKKLRSIKVKYITL